MPLPGFPRLRRWVPSLGYRARASRTFAPLQQQPARAKLFRFCHAISGPQQHATEAAQPRLSRDLQPPPIGSGVAGREKNRDACGAAVAPVRGCARGGGCYRGGALVTGVWCKWLGAAMETIALSPGCRSVV